MRFILGVSGIYMMLDMFRVYPLKVRLWLLLLISVHFVAPLFFLDHAPARWMAGAFVCAAMILGLMHLYFGLAKILGIAHTPWIVPMVLIYQDLFGAEQVGHYATWLIVAAAVGTLCLIIDAIDVARYFAGDRTPLSPPPG